MKRFIFALAFAQYGQTLTEMYAKKWNLMKKYRPVLRGWSRGVRQGILRFSFPSVHYRILQDNSFLMSRDELCGWREHSIQSPCRMYEMN